MSKSCCFCFWSKENRLYPIRSSRQSCNSEKLIEKPKEKAAEKQEKLDEALEEKEVAETEEGTEEKAENGSAYNFSCSVADCLYAIEPFIESVVPKCGKGKCYDYSHMEDIEILAGEYLRAA